MPTLAMAGWVLLRWARHPASWLWLSLVVWLWLAGIVFSPIGLTTDEGVLSGLFYELAFVLTLAGSAAALLPLSEAQWFLARLDGPARLRVRAAGLLAGGALGWAGALLLVGLGSRMSLLSLGSLASGGAATWVHATLLGLLLLSAPLSGTSRALALPLLGWVLPAMLPDAGLPFRTLQCLLDTSAHFGAESPTAAGSIVARAAALLALGGAAVLVETRATLRSPEGRARSPR